MDNHNQPIASNAPRLKTGTFRHIGYLYTINGSKRIRFASTYEEAQTMGAVAIDEVWTKA